MQNSVNRCHPNTVTRCLALGLMLFGLGGWAAPINAEGLGSFQRLETETLDKEDFVFPDDMRAGQLIIAMLAMSNEQESGERQGKALLEWYKTLDARGITSDGVRAYHFSVMKVPFFVKGLVRGGLADDFEGTIPLDQAAALFVKNLDKFAAAPGIELDGQPTLVLVDPQGNLLEAIKGDPTDENVARLEAAVAKYL